jgi:hypothetical protein
MHYTHGSWHTRRHGVAGKSVTWRCKRRDCCLAPCGLRLCGTAPTNTGLPRFSTTLGSGRTVISSYVHRQGLEDTRKKIIAFFFLIEQKSRKNSDATASVTNGSMNNDWNPQQNDTFAMRGRHRITRTADLLPLTRLFTTSYITPCVIFVVRRLIKRNDSL